MPIYEYRCGDCKHRVSVFFRSFADTNQSPHCPNCNGASLTRLVSRVATIKSEDARLEAMSDPSAFGDVDENDPKSMARFMRKMGDQMGGEDLGPEFGEMVDRLEAGENPEEIEKTMPGLGGEGEMGGLDVGS
ncbi:MAG: zinc ribbon domain-containing protein [Chloroflexi bacterium]|nr:zinc ribbon domain-containing protein [Chloroflexota bacterium]